MLLFLLHLHYCDMTCRCARKLTQLGPMSCSYIFFQENIQTTTSVYSKALGYFGVAPAAAAATHAPAVHTFHALATPPTIEPIDADPGAKGGRQWDDQFEMGAFGLPDFPAGLEWNGADQYGAEPVYTPTSVIPDHGASNQDVVDVFNRFKDNTP